MIEIQNLIRNTNKIFESIITANENVMSKQYGSVLQSTKYAKKSLLFAYTYRGEHRTKKADKMQNYLQTKYPDHEFSCALYENKVNGSNTF